MKYKDFAEIDIDVPMGVSSPGYDTFLVAKNTKKLSFKRALDVGTGTGFIAIYLTKCGLKCDGSDITTTAIQCAKNNAKKNSCDVDFFVSNLFGNIPHQYDLIIFNVPLGDSSSKFFSKILENFKSLLPRESKFLYILAYSLFAKKRRQKLLSKFFSDSKKHLTNNGKIIINLHKHEMSFLKGCSYKILDEYYDELAKIVLIN